MEKYLIAVLRKYHYLAKANSQSEFRKLNERMSNPEYQQKRLKEILTLAAKHIPYYKSLDVDPNVLNSFPVVDKSLMKSRVSEFANPRVIKTANHTSGSSGAPFKFYVNTNFFGMEWINAQRIWSKFFSNYKIKEPVITVRTHVPKGEDDIFRVDKFHNFWYISPYHISEPYLKRIIDYIEKSKSRIVRGYPSSAYILARLLAQHNIQIPQIGLVVVSSELLRPEYLPTIKKSFPNAHVCNTYGQNEGVLSMYTGPDGNWYNLDDYGYMELSMNNELIGTSLFNIAMPFIRYNTLDRVETAEVTYGVDGQLTAGVANIMGRSDDILFSVKGEPVSSINFSSAFKDILEIEAFQIFQNADLSIEYDYILSGGQGSGQPIHDRVKEEIIKRLGEVAIELKEVTSLQRNKKTGKVKIINQLGGNE